MNLVLILLLGFAAVLAMAFVFTRRRRGTKEKYQPPTVSTASHVTAPVAQAPAASKPGSSSSVRREPALRSAGNQPAAPAPAAPLAAARSSEKGPADAGSHEVGADFYEEVVGLLKAELSRNPQRDDLRVKLLEVYAATERKPEFVNLAALHLRAMKSGRDDPAWQRVAEMGRRLVPDHALFSKATPSAAPTPSVPAPKRLRRYYESVNADALAGLQTELHQAYQGMRQDMKFWKKLRELCSEFTGPPPVLAHARKLSSFVGGAQILVRNEAKRPIGDAAIASAVGQVLLAQTLGRWRVIASPAEEGHAVAVARAAQRLGLEATIVVTTSDEAGRHEEMARLGQAGAAIVIVPDGGDGGGRNEGQRAALALALEQGPGTLFVSPLSAGPFPYPAIVRELQGLFGLELKSQVRKLIDRLPDGVIVSASDGMPSVGFLQAFLASEDVKLFCVEALTGGSRSHRLGREHSWLRASGRVRYSSVPDEVAKFAARYCVPDGAGDLQVAGGEVLVETFTLAKQFSPEQAVVVVLPAEQS